MPQVHFLPSYWVIPSSRTDTMTFNPLTLRFCTWDEPTLRWFSPWNSRKLNKYTTLCSSFQPRIRIPNTQKLFTNKNITTWWISVSWVSSDSTKFSKGGRSDTIKAFGQMWKQRCWEREVTLPMSQYCDASFHLPRQVCLRWIYLKHQHHEDFCPAPPGPRDSFSFCLEVLKDCDSY